MEKQGTLLRLMLAALGVLLLGQLGTLPADRGPRTVTARQYSGVSSVYVQGVVIRRETVVTAAQSGDWRSAVSDGEKVAAGQTLLTLALPSEKASAVRLSLLAQTARAAAEQPAAQRRSALHDAIAALDAAEGADRIDAGTRVSGLLRGETGGTRVLAESETPTAAVMAAQSGVFSTAVDGLETLLTPEDPWAAWPLPRAAPPATALGRLVTGDVWYYRTELPFTPEPGDRLDAVLLGGLEQSVTLTVEEVRPALTGCRALLSCRMALAETASVRELAVKIRQTSESGVEIPREAVYTVKGEPGVWCLVGEAAVFKPVTVLLELEDTLVVALDRSTTAGLWPGDEIYLELPGERQKQR